MFDPMSTQFSAVQRETHKGVIGQQEYDRRTYEVLLGDGDERPAVRRHRRATLAAAAVSVLVMVGVALWWLAAL